MNPVVLSAVNSWLSKWLKGQKVPVGRHTVDQTITLRVRGEVLKCDDENYVPTVHVPLLETLEFLIPHLGATRESALEKMRSAMEQALLQGVKAKMPKPKDVEAAKKMVEDKYLGALPPAVRAGKTIVDCSVEEVGLTLQEIAEPFARNPQEIAV